MPTAEFKKYPTDIATYFLLGIKCLPYAFEAQPIISS